MTRWSWSIAVVGACLVAVEPIPVTAQDPVAPEAELADGAPAAGSGEEVVLVQETSRSHWVLRLGAGTFDYAEEASISDVVSDVSSPTLDLGIRYTYQDPTGFKLRASFDGWIADTDTETWRLNGDVVQRNDLEAAGLSLDGLFGVDLTPSAAGELNLWVGLGFRAQGFDRSRFRLYDEDGVQESPLGNVTESYAVGLFSAGVDGRYPVTPCLDLGGELMLGSVFFNEADNDALGTVTGQGGKTLDIRVFLSHSLSERDEVGVGIRYGFQELEGDVQVSTEITDLGLAQRVAEWPDNELERWSGELFWSRTL